ncbi:uncharacterized protein LOC143220596 [Lasioglossum baleicum]|uniref:uncharacterized protein LOC143220596 n=1 Tax=Lasioglossum baleicum TaxID=434251 RepID=UPI003FCCAD61
MHLGKSWGNYKSFLRNIEEYRQNLRKRHPYFNTVSKSLAFAMNDKVKRPSVLPLIYSDSEDDAINDNVDDNNGTWSMNDRTIVLETFEGSFGVKIMPRSSERIMDVVNLFIGNDLLEHMMRESNRYHYQVTEKYKIMIVLMGQQQLSLDECIIPWRGRLSIKTYNTAKITKYGISVRAVSEACAGYLCNICVYTANGKKLEDTVLSVIEPCKNMWHHIYQDNYFNSVKMAKIVSKNKEASITFAEMTIFYCMYGIMAKGM